MSKKSSWIFLEGSICIFIKAKIILNVFVLLDLAKKNRQFYSFSKTTKSFFDEYLLVRHYEVIFEMYLNKFYFLLCFYHIENRKTFHGQKDVMPTIHVCEK